MNKSFNQSAGEGMQEWGEETIRKTETDGF